jgi:hypothetical protein
VKGGLNLMADAIAGRGVKESFKKQLSDARDTVSHAIRSQIPNPAEKVSKQRRPTKRSESSGLRGAVRKKVVLAKKPRMSRPPNVFHRNPRDADDEDDVDEEEDD